MRLRSMLVFGLGYLFGTKAGKERYQELSQSVRTLASSDVAKDAMERARQAVGFPTGREQSPGNGEARSSSSQESPSQDSSSQGTSPDNTERDWEERGDGAWVPKDADQDQNQDQGQGQPSG